MDSSNEHAFDVRLNAVVRVRGCKNGDEAAKVLADKLDCMDTEDISRLRRDGVLLTEISLANNKPILREECRETEDDGVFRPDSKVGDIIDYEYDESGELVREKRFRNNCLVFCFERKFSFDFGGQVGIFREYSDNGDLLVERVVQNGRLIREYRSEKLEYVEGEY